MPVAFMRKMPNVKVTAKGLSRNDVTFRRGGGGRGQPKVTKSESGGRGESSLKVTILNKSD